MFHYQKTKAESDEWIEFGSPRIAPLYSRTSKPSKADENGKTGGKPKPDGTLQTRESPAESNDDVEAKLEAKKVAEEAKMKAKKAASEAKMQAKQAAAEAKKEAKEVKLQAKQAAKEAKLQAKISVYRSDVDKEQYRS